LSLVELCEASFWRK